MRALRSPTRHGCRHYRAPLANSSRYTLAESYDGAVVVIDDPLTRGPDLNSSKLLGRVQGSYVGYGGKKERAEKKSSHPCALVSTTNSRRRRRPRRSWSRWPGWWARTAGLELGVGVTVGAALGRHR
ncbi:hypothetical protein SEVIR_9G336050v4 [Setaria viridis]